ncbi:MAG: FAD:protein FMN transferase [Bacteroidaceae bacterium]|nr:FAD:protein FMN transferase [Bacteroidaceae bacterium]
MTKTSNRFRLWHIPVLLLLIIGTVFALTRHRVGQVKYQSEEGTIFGTFYHVKYQSDNLLTDKILHELNRVDCSLSMFNPRSTVSRINRGEDVRTDSLLNEVWALSEEVARNTDGAFDPTCAPLVNSCGFGFKHGELPTKEQVDSMLQFVDWRKVAIRRDTLVKEDPRIVLNFSAVAKGYGVDKVARMLERCGISNYMVEIGGEVVAHGVNPKGKPWRIGINKPVEDTTNINNEIQETIDLVNGSVATSGNYRNFFVRDGVVISHTIDPKSGYPVRHSLLSSTVWANTCATADAYATAFMVMGLDKAKSFLETHPELKAYFIYCDEQGKFQTWTNRNRK